MDGKSRTKMCYVLSVTASSIDNPPVPPGIWGWHCKLGRVVDQPPGQLNEILGFFIPMDSGVKKAQPRESQRKQNPVKGGGTSS